MQSYATGMRKKKVKNILQRRVNFVSDRAPPNNFAYLRASSSAFFSSRDRLRLDWARALGSSHSLTDIKYHTLSPVLSTVT